MKCLYVLLFCVAGFNIVSSRTVTEETADAKELSTDEKQTKRYLPWMLPPHGDKKGQDERLFPWMYPPFGDKKEMAESERIVPFPWMIPPFSDRELADRAKRYVDCYTDRTDCDEEWPWALMEFATFVGRCDHGKAVLDIFGLATPVEGVMAEGCPIAYEVADWLKVADKEHIRKAEKHFEEVFHIVQCGNLMGEVENIKRIMELSGTSVTTAFDSVFLRDATPLFDVCTRLFPTVQDEIVEFKGALNKIMDYFTMTKRYRPYIEASKRRYPYAETARRRYPYTSGPSRSAPPAL